MPGLALFIVLKNDIFTLYTGIRDLPRIFYVLGTLLAIPGKGVWGIYQRQRFACARWSCSAEQYS